MRQFSLLGLLLASLLLLNISLVLAQDEEAPSADAPAQEDPQQNAANQGQDQGQDEGQGQDESQEGDEEKGEECEEAWDYVEFMKASLKDKIENILQDVLFQPRSLLEETVTQTMEKVLEIRDDILARTKAIRTGDGDVIICPEQNIKQEEFLTQIRMQIMSVLLSLIEREAASPSKLQDIGKQLLAIRTKVNSEITRMIMLRESSGIVRAASSGGDCDCGILGEIVEGLDNVLASGEDEQNEQEGEEGGVNPYNPAQGEGESSSGNSSGNAVQELTMILMSVDAEIKTLYNQILAELDDNARNKLSEDLQTLKAISTDLHEVLSKLSELDPETDAEAIERLIRRDVRGIRNDVKRALDQCQEQCPGECDSCGANKIDEVSEKLKDYKASMEDLEEEEAKESVRGDLMAYLTQTNSDMTELLKKKAEDGELDECGTEELEVIDKIKGPLWMMVNITIFGDANTMREMIDAMEQALTEMRSQYCSADNTTVVEVRLDTDECDINEINVAKDWIGDIDTLISENIFKNEDDDGRRNAMLALIELKSSMDDRVRELFQDNLQCKEEVEQIKNIYSQKLTECLAEMMNPRFRFDLLGRVERVQCVKDLRILLEDRRGALLMREIEKRINESGSQAVGYGGVGDAEEGA